MNYNFEFPTLGKHNRNLNFDYFALFISSESYSLINYRLNFDLLEIIFHPIIMDKLSCESSLLCW